MVAEVSRIRKIGNGYYVSIGHQVRESQGTQNELEIGDEVQVLVIKVRPIVHIDTPTTGGSYTDRDVPLAHYNPIPTAKWLYDQMRPGAVWARGQLIELISKYTSDSREQNMVLDYLLSAQMIDVKDGNYFRKW